MSKKWVDFQIVWIELRKSKRKKVSLCCKDIFAPNNIYLVQNKKVNMSFQFPL